MGEQRYGEFITDESSAEAWTTDMEAAAAELSERARGIQLESMLFDSELEGFRSQLVGLVTDPDDFLRTRILKFIEAKNDPRIRRGMIEYIQDDINMLYSPST